MVGLILTTFVVSMTYLGLWQGYRIIYGGIKGLGHVVLTFGLLLNVGISILAAMRYAEALHLPESAFRLLVDTLVLAMASCFYVFCQTADGLTPRDRPIRVAILGFIGTVVALTSLTIAAATAENPNDHTVFTFETLLGVAYNTIFLVVASGCLTRSISKWMLCRARRTQDRPLRAGLYVAGGGLAVQTLSGICKIPPPIVALLGGPQWIIPESVSIVVQVMITTPAVFLGLSLPLVARSIARFRAQRLQYSAYKTLAPLWEIIIQAYPELSLNVELDYGRRLPNWTFQVDRRIAECLDGIHRSVRDRDVSYSESDTAAATLRRVIVDLEESNKASLLAMLAGQGRRSIEGLPTMSDHHPNGEISVLIDLSRRVLLTRHATTRSASAVR